MHWVFYMRLLTMLKNNPKNNISEDSPIFKKCIICL